MFSTNDFVSSSITRGPGQSVSGRNVLQSHKLLNLQAREESEREHRDFLKP